MFTTVDRERSLAACAVQEKVYKPYCIARYCVNEGMRELAPLCQAPYMSGAYMLGNVTNVSASGSARWRTLRDRLKGPVYCLHGRKVFAKRFLAYERT